MEVLWMDGIAVTYVFIYITHLFLILSSNEGYKYKIYSIYIMKGQGYNTVLFPHCAPLRNVTNEL